jgi:hypothetical protein
MAEGGCGTKLNGVPPDEDMREARRRHRFGRRFFVVMDDPDIGACRVAVENIVAAQRLIPRRRGRSLDARQLLAAIEALEKAGVPLRINNTTRDIIASELRLREDTARSLLRRLIDLRKRLTGK